MEKIDKISIAIDMILASLGGGKKLSARDAFTTVDEIERESIMRGIYFPTHCNRCGGEIHVINAASSTDKYYIVKCDCRSKRGLDLQKVKMDFINDN